MRECTTKGRVCGAHPTPAASHARDRQRSVALVSCAGVLGLDAAVGAGVDLAVTALLQDDTSKRHQPGRPPVTTSSWWWWVLAAVAVVGLVNMFVLAWMIVHGERRDRPLDDGS